MHTFFDFMTHIKGEEYIIALLFIALFMLFWELLKPKPLASVTSRWRGDMEHLKRRGWSCNWKSVACVVAAPLIGLGYVIALPFVFVGILLIIALEQVAKLVHGVVRFAGRRLSHGPH